MAKRFGSIAMSLILALPVHAAENICGKILEDFIVKNGLGTSVDKLSPSVDRKIQPFHEVLDSLEVDIKRQADKLWEAKQEENRLKSKFFYKSPDAQKFDMSSDLPGDADIKKAVEAVSADGLVTLRKGTDTKKFEQLVSQQSLYIKTGSRLNCSEKDKTSRCRDLASASKNNKKNILLEIENLKKQIIAASPLAAKEKQQVQKDQKALRDAHEKVQRLEDRLRYFRYRVEAKPFLRFLNSNSFTESGSDDNSKEFERLSLKYKVTTYQVKRPPDSSRTAQLAELKKQEIGLRKTLDSMDEIEGIETAKLGDLYEQKATWELKAIAENKTLPSSVRQKAKDQLFEYEKTEADHKFIQDGFKKTGSQLQSVLGEIEKLSSSLVEIRTVSNSKNEVIGLYFPPPLNIKMVKGCVDITVENEANPSTVKGSVLKQLFGVESSEKIMSASDRSDAEKKDKIDKIGGDLKTYLKWAEGVRKKAIQESYELKGLLTKPQPKEPLKQRPASNFAKKKLTSRGRFV